MPVPVDPDNPTPEELDELFWYELATELAWTAFQTLTAYQVALCPIEIRPCKDACYRSSYREAVVTGPDQAPFYPLARNGQWVNVWCGHSRLCECTGVKSITLPTVGGAIEEVTINGEVVPPEAYRLDNGTRLVRIDGGDWPLCQDMNAPAGEQGSFVVRYYSGAIADRTVLFAVGVLAGEWIKSLTGDLTCRLPAGTTTIERQGLSIELQANLFVEGSVGIPEVDAVVARFNPFRQKMPATFFSLDRPPARRTTWRG